MKIVKKRRCVVKHRAKKQKQILISKKDDLDYTTYDASQYHFYEGSDTVPLSTPDQTKVSTEAVIITPHAMANDLNQESDAVPKTYT